MLPLVLSLIRIPIYPFREEAGLRTFFTDVAANKGLVFLHSTLRDENLRRILYHN
jgi:hypothetical protein